MWKELKAAAKSVVVPVFFSIGVYERTIAKYHKKKAIVLMGHRISDATSSLDQEPELLEFERGITQERFDDLMRYVRAKMNPVSVGEVTDFVSGQRDIPDRAVAVTFDDGYWDNYSLAYPTLKQYDIPATIYLTTGFIGTNEIQWWDRIGEILKRTEKPNMEMREVFEKLGGKFEGPAESLGLTTSRGRNAAWLRLTLWLRPMPPSDIATVVQVLEELLDVDTTPHRSRHRMLGWEQVREMHKAGLEFGAHTVTHRSFSELSESEIEKEVLDSKKAIEEKIGAPVVSFAYPFGDLPHNSDAWKNMFRKHGFRSAFLTYEGSNEVGTDPLDLRRIGIGNVPLGYLAREMSRFVRPDR